MILVDESDTEPVEQGSKKGEAGEGLLAQSQEITLAIPGDEVVTSAEPDQTTGALLCGPSFPHG